MGKRRVIAMLGRTPAARPRVALRWRATTALGLAVGCGLLFFTPGVASADVVALSITSASVANGAVTVNGTVTCTTQGNALETAIGVEQASGGSGQDEVFAPCAASGGTQAFTKVVLTHIPVPFVPGSAIITGCSRDNTSGDGGGTGFAICLAPQTFALGAPPAVTSFSPVSGPVGTVVTLKGTDLGGATKVTFNGVKATITSDTSTKLKVKVPSGATTGKIKVVTPIGTVKTVTSFRVT